MENATQIKNQLIELLVEELTTFEKLKNQEHFFYNSDVEDIKHSVGKSGEKGLQYPITYTVNWSVKTKDGEEVFKDHQNSRKTLEQTRDRAEQVFQKYPNSKIWLTKWVDDQIMKDDIVIHEPVVDKIQEDKLIDESVIIDSGLQYSIKETEIIKKFLDYVKENLGLETIPKLHILDKRKDGMTYGMFDPNTEEIKVYGKRRGLADVLRTSAHEYVHYKQKTDGKIPKNLNHRDHALESEANSKAGDLIYMFGLEHPEIYEMGDGSEDEIEVPKD
jgi:hypothetical protein